MKENGLPANLGQSAQYEPRMMLALLIYFYAHVIVSSRRIERATWRDLGVRYVTANQEPHRATITKLRALASKYRSVTYRPAGELVEKPEMEIKELLGKADWLRKPAEKLQTDEGKQLYALRKQTVEPVFGVIKSALGFRMFLLPGIELAPGKWNLVTLAYNCTRAHTLRLAEEF